eukprot:6330-Heterococcus_DN1.PRE.2
MCGCVHNVVTLQAACKQDTLVCSTELLTSCYQTSSELAVAALLSSSSKCMRACSSSSSSSSSMHSAMVAVC